VHISTYTCACIWPLTILLIFTALQVLDAEWRTKYAKCSVIDHRLFGILPRFLTGPDIVETVEAVDTVKQTGTEIDSITTTTASNQLLDVSIGDVCHVKELSVVMKECSLTPSASPRNVLIPPNEDSFVASSLVADSLVADSSITEIFNSSSSEIVHSAPAMVEEETAIELDVELRTEIGVEIEEKDEVRGRYDINACVDLGLCIPDSHVAENVSSSSDVAHAHSPKHTHAQTDAQAKAHAHSHSQPRAYEHVQTEAHGSEHSALKVMPCPVSMLPSCLSLQSSLPPLSSFSPLSPLSALSSLSPPRCTSPHFSSPSSSSTTSTSSSPSSSSSSSSSTIDFNTLRESLSGDILDDVIHANWPREKCINHQALKVVRNNDRAVEWVDERSEGDEESWGDQGKGFPSILANQLEAVNGDNMGAGRLITGSISKELRTDSRQTNAVDVVNPVLNVVEVEERSEYLNFSGDKNGNKNVHKEETEDLLSSPISIPCGKEHRNLHPKRPVPWNLLGAKSQFCPIPFYAKEFISGQRKIMLERKTNCCEGRDAGGEGGGGEEEVKEVEEEEGGHAVSCSSHSTAVLFQSHYKRSIQLLGLVSCSVTPTVRPRE
jgi:hypothetical protein